MKELWEEIEEVFYGERGEGELSGEVKRVVERADRVLSSEEPDYDVLWRRVQRRTIARGDRRRLWLMRVAAVLLPVLVGVLSVYVVRMKQEMVASREMAAQKRQPVEDIRLVLEDGRVMKLPKNTPGEVLRTARMAIRQEMPAAITYQVEKAGTQEPEYHILEIPAGADYRLILSDGSVVYLNSASRLKYPVVFAGSERRVYLEGEGYFEVESDPGHPFRVEIGNTVVEAVGTAFNVNAYPEKAGVEATLVKGKVNVREGEQNVVLSPGQQAHCTGRSIEVREVDCREFVSWKDGKFIFNRMSLEHIMMQMERWYGLTVFFRNDALKQYTFTGMIDKHLLPEETFRVIEKTVKVHFNLKGGTVVIE